MPKVFIEETTLTAIGNAIREKEGTTELVPVNDMATRISAIETGSDPIIESLEITSNGTYTATDCDGYSPITVNVPQDGGPPEEAFTISGNKPFFNYYGTWDWFFRLYGHKVKTENLDSCQSIFQGSNLTEIPCTINIVNVSNFTNAFSSTNNLQVCPKVRGSINCSTALSMDSMVTSVKCIRDFEDLFEPEMLDGYSNIKVTSTYSVPRCVNFNSCSSLRRIPSWWYKYRLNEESTAFPYLSYTLYNYAFTECESLDEAKDIPVWHCLAPAQSNMFNYIVSGARRLKSFTFETNNGQPVLANWKSQVIDLSSRVGYNDGSLVFGFTVDKRVNSDERYQALKNDPDWYAAGSDGYKWSRYNHDSAVETINSLPDTSAYLASAGGSNIIKFKGAAGSNTDGGAINTLTAEEIAVATAKGWTVTLA